MKMRITFGWLITFSLMTLLGSAQIYLKSEQRLSDSLSYRQKFDGCIKNLDKSKFSTGVLYDRIYPFARLLNFTSDTPKDSSSYEHFIQAYYEIYLASYDNSKLKTFQEVKRLARESSAKGQISIGIINYQINSLDSTALQDNALIMQNKKLIQGSNSNRAYVKKSETFVASLLTKSIKSGLNTFNLDTSFVYSNTKQKIDRVEIDFGKESGVLTLLPNQRKSFTVKGSGNLSLGYTLFFKNGKRLRGFSKVEIVSVSGVKSLAIGINYCDSIRIISIKEYCGPFHSGPYINILDFPRKGTADMLIYYSNCSSKQLTKPIIIYDGFDPGDTRNGNDIYKLINKDYYLADKLRAKGFDLVIVNFPDGADFIVRNAYAAETAIKWVNEHKTTANKLVVIGPSMGGLISRYALADLEREGYNHQVGLWVSFDAPHQGANISIGDQYFLDFFGRAVNNAGAREGLDKLESPAALQMLVDHYSKQWVYGWDYSKPAYDTYRRLFKNELINNGLPGSNGYPMNLRKIALLNGSGKGNNQEGIDVPEYLLEMRKKVAGYTVGLGQVKTSADKSFTTRWVLYAFTAKPSIYSQRWSEPDPSPYFTTSFDKAPGGNTKTQNTLAEGGSGFTVYYPGHSFIPSVSALDLATPDLKMDISSANIIANKLTPFDSYYAPDENQEHITFKAPSINWIESELGTNWEIAGSELVCSNSNSTFNVLNLPQHATVTWSQSKNLTPVVGQGTNSYTIKTNSSGSGWVNATVSIGWDIRVIQKNFWVGANKPGPITITFNAPPRRISASINPVPNATTYKWYLDGVLKYTDSRTDAIFQRQMDNCDHVYYIVVAAINACGSSDISHAEVSEDPCYYGFSIFPNPASDNITIAIGSAKNMASSSPVNATDTTRLTSKFILTSAYTVRIIDNFGVLKAILKKSGEMVTIPISNLRDGIYIVEINDGVNIYRQQLLVKH